MQRFKLLLVVIAVLAIWFVLGGGLSLYVDSLWFNSVGYLDDLPENPLVEVPALAHRVSEWRLGILSINLRFASRSTERGILGSSGVPGLTRDRTATRCPGRRSSSSPLSSGS